MRTAKSIKLSIVATHPVQYNAPWFRLLAQQPELNVKVFYTWSQSKEGAKYDPGFGKVIEWDIPLLEGYDFEFVENIAKDPGSHHFKGIDNPTLNKQITDWKPDAILVIGWSYKSHLSCMRYFKGKVPVLFRGDSTLLDETPGIKKFVRRLFLTYVYSFVDHALYVGSNNKEYFLAHKLKNKQLHYVPHAIDNCRFSKDEELQEKKARDWRSSLGFKEDSFVILFAGKLESKKDPFFIIKLADQLTSSKLRFVLVGNGPLEKELKEKAKNDNRIVFLDFQNQRMMPVVYRLCDVFILPSKGPGETWGLAINEAMACGRAVMASNKAGGAIDLIKPKINGFIIDDKKPLEAFNFIKEVIESKHLTATMGASSKQIVKSFSFKAIVDNTTALLMEINNSAS